MESNENEHLTPRQLQVIPYILSCASYEEAARQADISPKQIFEWLKDPVFKQELKSQRSTMFCNSLSYLKAGMQKAAETLISLLDNEDPRIKLQASEKVLSLSFKAAELYDIEERLVYVEALVKKKS